MECNSRQRQFPYGQPGACIDGYLNTNIIQIGSSQEAEAPDCTSHNDTGLAYTSVLPLKYFNALLQPGSYIIEICGSFKITATKGYTYYHSFKQNIGTGLWQIIPSAKKEIVNSVTSAQSYQLVHLKSDIITLTAARSIGYFHGIKKTEPTDGPASVYNVNMIIFKL